MKRKILFLCLLIFSFINTSYADNIATNSQINYDEKFSKKTIEINDIKDLEELSKRTNIDSFSKNKKIILNNDIDVLNSKFKSISNFSGHFDGNSHTIKGFKVQNASSIVALFLNVKEGAIVENLNFEGRIESDGTQNILAGIVAMNSGKIKNCTFDGYISGTTKIGGIVGTNSKIGVIDSCSVKGQINGKSYIGGICGENLGEITLCTNFAKVNTIYEDESNGLQDIQGLKDFFDDNSTKAATSTYKDIGGICGYSSGKINLSTNFAEIGYKRVGYNVAGVVGRSGGYVSACINNGNIYGRKDIGGIVGQLEPEVEKSLIGDTSSDLKKETENLNKILTKTNEDFQFHSSNVSAILTKTNDDLSNLKDDGIEEIQNLSNTLFDIGTYISNMEDIIKDINDVIKAHQADTSITDLLGMIQEINEVISLNDINGNLDMGTQIQSDALELRKKNSTIDGYLSTLLKDMTFLNEALDNMSSDLSSDFTNVNNQIKRLSDMIVDPLVELEELNAEDKYMDVSTENIDTTLEGKVYSSKNNSMINGDLNIGGIVGTIDVEYDGAPENDSTDSDILKLRTRYYRKTVVQNGINQGKIYGKTDSIGGIVGRMNMGIVVTCESYGFIEAKDASYVGGVVGHSNSNVTKCFSTGDISGHKYVGGIVGMGNMVSYCYTLANINDAIQFFGAISGYMSVDYELNFHENYYVSDNLYGIDRFSFVKRAEKIEYEDLKKKIKQLPDRIQTFTLSFVLEEDEDDSSKDKLLRQYTFQYGESFDQRAYPYVEKKEGYYSIWDNTSLKNLKCDTVIKTRYINYITTVESFDKRENGKAVFLAISDFASGDGIKVDLLGEETINESRWHIIIEKSINNQKETKMRYLPYTNKNNNSLVDYDVYLFDGENYIKTQSKYFASYIEFIVDKLDFEVLFKRKSIFNTIPKQ
ncbi:MAG: GLUG motif-containing protein [Eubacteriales bacterium]|nr:GLUG motif-containing protein [Eubacteriales bacterium]